MFIAATVGCGLIFLLIACTICFQIGQNFGQTPPPPLMVTSFAGPAPSPSSNGKLMVTSFVPYFNYQGSLKVQGTGAIESNRRNPSALGKQIISFDLEGVDTLCSGNPPDVANACGIHIHNGVSCGVDALGHYWNTKLVTVDPWKYVTYHSVGTNAKLDEVLLMTGLDGFDINGHTMIVHDSTGLRIACGIVEAPKLLVPAFGKYLGYNGSLNVQGSVEVSGKGSGVGAYQDIKWHLTGLPKRCLRGPGDLPNSCGIHIHKGFSCEDAQGHFYNTTEDPWKHVVYNGGDGKDGPIVTNTTMYDVLGRTFVVHDYGGARVACGIIQPRTDVVPALGKYGTYAGALQVSGRVTIKDAGGFGLEPAQSLSWSLTGVDPMCTETVPADAKPNACGIRIHTNRDCTDAGNHYYNPGLSADPWKHVTYMTASGRSETKNVVVFTGVNMYDINGRAVVVHDHTGARVGCGLINIRADSDPLIV